VSGLGADEREALDAAIRQWEDHGGAVLPYVIAAVERIIGARLAAVEALAERWAIEAEERGPDDHLLTAGVVDMLRAALTGGVGGAGTGEA
jgi:hypothetical protein